MSASASTSPPAQASTPAASRHHRPLTRAAVEEAHALIKPHIHATPVLTNTTLSQLASTPQTTAALQGTPWQGQKAATPKMRLFFKCENFQRIGAFKVRGAFHAVLRLIEAQGLDEVRRTGVVTHSSGNHAQALALAARTFAVPAHIVMPTISTPSKIAGTRAQGANLYFSGSTAQEREAVVADVIAQTGATLIPPYDHPNIILGQGTMALELEADVAALLRHDPALGLHATTTATDVDASHALDAVVAPCGGGGMLSGIAVALHNTGTRVFGCEPSFQGGDDARRGVAAGQRITSVKTLTIADGLRTPLGTYTWDIVSRTAYVAGLYAVTEQNIKDAMKLVLERMKCFVEPSAVVGLAALLYNEDFRHVIEREAGDAGWNVGVVFSGGNTTVEAVMKLFADDGRGEAVQEREGGLVGMDGRSEVENVAG